MFEVFNALTGETIGYVDSDALAFGYTCAYPGTDYINADEECSCSIDNDYCGLWVAIR